MYIADNLDLLRSLNDECIDLVCIDPPFAKNETFHTNNKYPLTPDERESETRLLRNWGVRNRMDADRAGIEWNTEGTGRYSDIWFWEDNIREEWVKTIEKDHAGIHSLISTTRLIHGDHIAAYLCYMAIRLIEVHRVLKPTGSLFPHCDTTANSYLRLLLDGIFGDANRRNEVVWCYTGPGSPKMRQFNRKHDTIYWYAKGEDWVFNRDSVRVPYKDPKQRPRRAFDTGSAFDDDYIDAMRKRGKVLEDWWSDIAIAARTRTQIVGYPTQKPWLLAKRIIEASTNPGDVVLDCFAGCAYVPIAAEKTGRQWTACDINPRAWTMFKRQFNKPQLIQVRCHDETTGQRVMAIEPVVTVHGPAELPERTSPVSEAQPKSFDLPERGFKVPASIIPEREMLVELLELSGYTAWCCGFANRMPSGNVIRTTDNFQLDHIDPKSKDGSSDIFNRAPMCQAHNNRKGLRRVHLDDYRKEVAEAGGLKVETMGDLVQLPMIRREVEGIHARAYAKKYPLEQQGD